MSFTFRREGILDRKFKFLRINIPHCFSFCVVKFKGRSFLLSKFVRNQTEGRSFWPNCFTVSGVNRNEVMKLLNAIVDFFNCLLRVWVLVILRIFRLLLLNRLKLIILLFIDRAHLVVL